MRSRTNNRNHITKSMICRGTRKNPFQSWPSVLFVPPYPRIIPTFRSMGLSEIHNIEKVLKTQPAHIRSIRAYHIPSLKSIRIIQISARHPCQSLKMLREKSLVDPKEKQEEMSLSMMLRILTSSKFPYPKIKGSKNTKHSSHTEDVVKMPDHIVSIVQSYIDSPICQNNSSQSSKSELHKKSLGKQHRSSLPKRSTIKSPLPTKNFNSSRNCNNHSRTGKIPTCVHIKTHCIHMVSPYQKSKDCNSSHCIHHSYISKNRFTCKKTKNMAYNTKPRKNLHINFRMTKKPNIDIFLNTPNKEMNFFQKKKIFAENKQCPTVH